MTQAGMQPQYQCINPGNPYSDVEVGMPDEEIDPAVCAKMGIPEVCPSRAYASRASAWPLSAQPCCAAAVSLILRMHSRLTTPFDTGLQVGL